MPRTPLSAMPLRDTPVTPPSPTAEGDTFAVEAGELALVLRDFFHTYHTGRIHVRKAPSAHTAYGERLYLVPGEAISHILYRLLLLLGDTAADVELEADATELSLHVIPESMHPLRAEDRRQLLRQALTLRLALSIGERTVTVRFPACRDTAAMRQTRVARTAARLLARMLHTLAALGALPASDSNDDSDGDNSTPPDASGMSAAPTALEAPEASKASAPSEASASATPVAPDELDPLGKQASAPARED